MTEQQLPQSNGNLNLPLLTLTFYSEIGLFRILFLYTSWYGVEC